MSRRLPLISRSSPVRSCWAASSSSIRVLRSSSRTSASATLWGMAYATPPAGAGCTDAGSRT
ncbi:hypothetical protein SGLAM104S_02081 [Streptomyces glaucescens]